ncbi:hypothetical protein HPB50_011322 [Hyalomma asiaticum]|uniref:Uncharacterized protein n=1 Tax=Hyalomma asiaticum TaxID=266040 RepID=A0ACB7SMN0_HYAAI|nr:hypothetical protein HPB50_011322 [Hyalomma asiaticum]
MLYENWILECVLLRMRRPKLYEHLQKQKILVLPSPTCLLRYVRNFKSGFGFNDSVFQALSAKTESMDVCSRHGGIIFDELKLSEQFGVYQAESSERSPEHAAPEGKEDDMEFLGLLSSKVELADYVTIDDGIVVAGRLNDDEIISAALGEMDEASDEDPCDELCPDTVCAAPSPTWQHSVNVTDFSDYRDEPRYYQTSAGYNDCLDQRPHNVHPRRPDITYEFQGTSFATLNLLRK